MYYYTFISDEMHMSLKQKSNLWMLISLVAGTMIGSGIFTLPATLASYGSISIIAGVITTIGAVLIAFIFAKLSVLIPKTGGPYAYCRAAWGDFIGFEVAYNYWIATCIGNAAVVVTCVGYLADFFPIIKEHAWLSFFLKAGMIWLFTGINILGVKNVSFLNMLTFVFKLLPLLFIGFIGLFFIHKGNYLSFNISHDANPVALSNSAMLILWSFVGIEAATVSAGYLSNKQFIAKATIIGTLIAAFVNLLCIVAIMGLIPTHELANSTAPFTDAAKLLFPHHIKLMSCIVSIGAIVACLGTLNACIMLQGHVALASANDKLFPKLFAIKNYRNVPVAGLTISSVLITLLLLLTVNEGLLHQFQLMILMATLASLIPYLFTMLGAILLINKHAIQFTRFEYWKILAIAIIASMYAMWAILSAGSNVLFCGILLFMSGIPIYIAVKYKFTLPFFQTSTLVEE